MKKIRKRHYFALWGWISQNEWRVRSFSKREPVYSNGLWYIETRRSWVQRPAIKVKRASFHYINFSLWPRFTLTYITSLFFNWRLYEAKILYIWETAPSLYPNTCTAKTQFGEKRRIHNSSVRAFTKDAPKWINSHRQQW